VKAISATTISRGKRRCNHDACDAHKYARIMTLESLQAKDKTHFSAVNSLNFYAEFTVCHMHEKNLN